MSLKEQSSGLQDALRLLYPGLRFKRWLLLGGVGLVVAALGVAYVLTSFFDSPFPKLLPYWAQGLLFGLLGLAVICVAAYGFYRSVGPLLLSSHSSDSLAHTLYSLRQRERGPLVVAIGGGTGLSTLLRGLKEHTSNLTAIVTVADDGGKLWTPAPGAGHPSPWGLPGLPGGYGRR